MRKGNKMRQIKKVVKKKIARKYERKLRVRNEGTRNKYILTTKNPQIHYFLNFITSLIDT